MSRVDYHLHGVPNWVVEGMMNVPKKLYIEIRHQIMEMEQDYILNHLPKIGGPGVRVQVDETYIKRFLRSDDEIPSSASDELRGAKWWVGGVQENNPRRCFIVPVENRNIETMTNVLREHIAPGSVIISDAHRSYPGAVAAMYTAPDNCIQIQVNSYIYNL